MEKDIILTEREKKRFEKQRRKAEGVFLKNKKKGLSKMIKLCKKGNPNAALFLDECMLHGLTITQKDEEIGAYLYMCSILMKMAADMGDNASRFEVAKRYEKGECIKKDGQKAFHYMSLAARGGLRAAMSNMAVYYEQGIGTKQSVKDSLWWEREGVDRGCLFCMKAIGQRYENGKGVPVNYERAIEWYTKARDKAQELLDTNGEGEPGYSEEDTQRVLDLTTEALERMEIIRVFKEYEEMKTPYLKDLRRNKILQYANDGAWLAQFYMGVISEEMEDYQGALRWYELAANNGGSTGAMSNMGRIYYYGKGVDVDYKVAYEYFMKAARTAANKSAMSYLGEMYEKGRYVKADFETACYWYREAALQGDTYAKERLAELNIS